jgi:hypothetical protein
MHAARFILITQSVPPFVRATPASLGFMLSAFKISPELLRLSVAAPIIIEALHDRPAVCLPFLRKADPLHIIHALNFPQLCEDLRKFLRTDDQMTTETVVEIIGLLPRRYTIGAVLPVSDLCELITVTFV